MNAQDGRKSALPPNARVAEELRGGISLVDLAAKYGVSVALVKIRLNDAGWGSDGQPNHRHPARPLLGVLDDQPWAERGLCSQTDPEEFFPEKGGPGQVPRLRAGARREVRRVGRTVGTRAATDEEGVGMSISIPAALARQLYDQVQASDQTRRALDVIASEHGLMIDELMKVVRHVEKQPRVPGKRCTGCQALKPLTEFYDQKGARDGKGSQCRACNNTREPTEARLLRTRARTRATAVLVKKHRAEFLELCEAAFAEVQVEHARLVAAAAGNADGATARLKPGPKRKDETDVVQRLDVARCPTCHTHHDDKHVCPTCGDETPEKADEVKPYLIRAWARDQGLSPIPLRGPLPARIVAAYDDEHPHKAAS